MQYTGMLDDEEFVGNINVNRELSYLTGVEHRAGELALDIHGNKIDTNYMRPLFVKRKDSMKYDRIMMQRLKEDRTSCAKSPAQNTVEICHTAPNRPKAPDLQVAMEL